MTTDIEVIEMSATDRQRRLWERRAYEITRPTFVERMVHPLVAENSTNGDVPAECETTVVQDRGTGRITVSYRFADDTQVYGKLYSDELGVHGYKVTHGLWEDGFANGEPFLVSQPLLYDPELNLLLTAEAKGTPLLSFIGDDGEVVLEHVRRAAQWLVRLHRSEVRIGPPDSLWESLRLFKIMRRQTKAASRAPQERKRMNEAIKALSELTPRCLEGAPLVQTHGRYHYEHVYVDGENVTLIDFDRSQPSDPAKDLAEFLVILRHRTFKQTGSIETAEAPSRVFLDEYMSHLPEYAANLAPYWGAFLIESMFKYVKREGKSNRPAKNAYYNYEDKMRFYENELELAISGDLTTGSSIREQRLVHEGRG